METFRNNVGIIRERLKNLREKFGRSDLSQTRREKKSKLDELVNFALDTEKIFRKHETKIQESIGMVGEHSNKMIFNTLPI